MSTEPDLQVDTDWIRRAAATLQRTGEQFSPGTGGPLPSVGSYSLGTSAAAIEVVELVIRRGSQARDAATALAVIATTIGDNLLRTASLFEHLETGLTRGPR